jgi:H+/Na+-translocating ferredoxin:NAD+ oxidoreductase subunit D
MGNRRYVVSLAPHARHGRTIRSMMLTMVAALVPATLWGFYQFGFNAVALVLAGVLGAVGTEAIINTVKKEKFTFLDGHALLVGLMLALLLPAGVPWWIALIGGVMAILIGKAPFGPLGGAPMSPTLIGLLIVALSWQAEINTYVNPRGCCDAESSVENAAPAESPQDAAIADPSDAADYCVVGLFLGNQVAPVGCASPLLLLLGGLFLFIRKNARWQAPFGFILGIAVFAGSLNAIDPGTYAPASFHLLTGAAMFGAFFLCTEPTCTPVTPWGMFLFGFMGGCLTVLFRISGLHFGRVAFALAIMSLATPLFDRIAQTPFGKVATHA